MSPEKYPQGLFLDGDILKMSPTGPWGHSSAIRCERDSPTNLGIPRNEKTSSSAGQGERTRKELGKREGFLVESEKLEKREGFYQLSVKRILWMVATSTNGLMYQYCFLVISELRTHVNSSTK